MTVDVTRDSARSATAKPPLLFISHKRADKDIADVLRSFVNNRSGGRIKVFQSSSAEANGPRVGRELNRELWERLWAAGVVLLVYTSPDEDWSYCMWECGVATHPQSPETKIVVIQCGTQPPSVYLESVRVNVRDPVDIQRFVNEFLTDTDFFPNYGEAIAPGFSRNGNDVRQAGTELYDALNNVIPPREESKDWATVPFLRLLLTYAEVDRIKDVGDVEGSRLVHEAARVREIDDDAKRIFGVGPVDTTNPEPFSNLTAVWHRRRPGESTKWVEDLCEQIRVGCYWQRLPPFRWWLMRSADDFDRARYSPVLSRVRSVPRQKHHQFDIYFSRFDTDEKGAVKIGFVDEPQAGPY